MKTISFEVSDQFIIKKSEFIGIATPVVTMDDALCRVKQAWSVYENAHHIAWAAKVSNRVRIHDDGEPSGTAGMPILNVIQHQQLENILVMVIRYYGGIKLGAGGLTRAYSQGAAIAIQQAELVEFVPMQKLELNFQFSKEGQIRRMIHEYDADILAMEYQTDCHMLVEVEKARAKDFTQALTDVCHGQLEAIPK